MDNAYIFAKAALLITVIFGLPLALVFYAMAREVRKGNIDRFQRFRPNHNMTNALPRGLATAAAVCLITKQWLFGALLGLLALAIWLVFRLNSSSGKTS